MEGGIGKMRIY